MGHAPRSNPCLPTGGPEETDPPPNATFRPVKLSNGANRQDPKPEIQGVSP